MSQARGQVIAINLAREGIEMMFNIRDTNIRKWSGKKDACWLNANTIFAAAQDDCEHERWIGGYGTNYFPYFAVSTGGTKIPVVATGAALDIFDGSIGVNDKPYEMWLSATGDFIPAIFFSGGGNLSVSNCNYSVTGTANLGTVASGCPTGSLSAAGRFYRTINNVRLYDKHTTTTGGRLLGCINGAATDTLGSAQLCGEVNAKELRFCSEVQYIVDKSIRRVTMCSLITNFKE